MSPHGEAAALERLRNAVAHAFGLRVEDDRLPELASGLRRALVRRGVHQPEAYIRRLGRTPASEELAELATQLTVSETYFFRNAPQMAVIQEELVRLAHAQEEPHVRVLSAGCSTGEESYSVAMLALDWLANPGCVAVTGVDLNPISLRYARRARYGAWALRQVDEERRRRHFTTRGGKYEVNEAARRLVRFEQVNLADPGARLGGPYHVVLCRNVLMYFLPDVARAVVSRLHDILVPTGLLLLGDAESLRGLSTTFDLCQAEEAFFYRKPSRRRSVAVPSPSRVDAVSPAPRTFAAPAQEALRRGALEASKLEHLTQQQVERSPGERLHSGVPAPSEAVVPSLDRVWTSFREERYEEALATLHALPTVPKDPDRQLLRALLLLHSRRTQDARDACLALLAEDELHASAHYLLALCLDEAGEPAAAAEQDRAAIYLEPSFALPHMHLGRLLRRRGHHRRARQEFSVALGLLPQEDRTRLILFGGGFGREALMDACRAELLSCGDAP